MKTVMSTLWIWICLALVPLDSRASATTALFATGWNAADLHLQDGPHPGRAHSEVSRSGAFEDGGTYAWLAASTASDRSGDLHTLLETNSATGFGNLSSSGSLVGSVTFLGSAPRLVRFVLDVHGGLHSTTGASSMHAGGFLGLGASASHAGLMTLGDYPDVVMWTSSGHAELLDADREALHLRLWLEALVLPGVAYELSAQLSTSIGAASPDITRADFLHTAQLSVFLPPDLTMVGANGFLSELPGVGGGALPEPGGLTLAGLAALATITAARRRRRPGA